MGGFRGREQQGNFFIMGRLSKRVINRKENRIKKEKTDNEKEFI